MFFVKNIVTKSLVWYSLKNLHRMICIINSEKMSNWSWVKLKLLKSWSICPIQIEFGLRKITDLLNRWVGLC